MLSLCMSAGRASTWQATHLIGALVNGQMLTRSASVLDAIWPSLADERETLRLLRLVEVVGSSIICDNVKGGLDR